MDVFVHIPKSSGSTIRAVLSRQYGVEKILYFEPNAPSWKEKNIHPDKFLRDKVVEGGTRLITGHYPFEVHALLKTACRYFSMVRDPIERSLSEYYYAFSYPHHRLREEIVSGKLSVDEFLTTPRYAPPNAQAAMLAGPWKSLGGEIVTAIENIRTSFAVVGSAERFDKSILLIAKAFCWKPPLYVNKNVTKLDGETSAKRSASREALGRYKESFKVDYKAYQAVDTLLTDRVQSEGGAFKSALEAFREIQADIASRTSDEVFKLYELQGDDPLPEFALRFVESGPYRKIKEYLDSPSAIQQIGKNYVGQIESHNGRTVSGWATDLSRSQPIEVCVWLSGEPIAHSRCDIARDDIAQAGFPSHRIGFVEELPKSIMINDELTVCFEDTPIQLMRTGSP